MIGWLVGAWVIVELSAQLARWGVTKMWRAPLPGGRGGITFHPLLIFIANPALEDHERVHARQMARFSWTGWLVLYVFSGRWRACLEAEAYAGSAREARSDQWVEAVAEIIRGPTYFRSWWPGKDPGRVYVKRALERYLP